MAASVPDVSNFRGARDLAASCRKHALGMMIGLTPQPHSSGGKEKLGKITKMGNRHLRHLLYRGTPCWKHAFGMTAQITHPSHKPAGEDWLWNMLQRKPVKLVAIALAARMACTLWALTRTGESFEAKAA